MFIDQKIAFVGSGNMAEAMIAGLIEQGLVTAEQIMAADIRPERGRELYDKYGVMTTTDNGEAVTGAAVVVMAVKPQYFAQAAVGIRDVIPSASLVISIMAGTTIETVTGNLLHGAVVRSMPNTPAQVGQGMTMWTATDAVTDVQKAQATAVLTSFGKALYADSEHYLDMATAINGSGPGYVFLMLESMVDAGVKLGFPRQVAAELVMQTVLGSVTYAQESGEHLAVLRNQVTSPGGTTAAGLYALEKGGLRTVLADGIFAAYERSVELGKK